MIDIAAPKDDAERLDWLRLIRTENVGPITFLELMRRFETAAKALETLPELARRGGRRRPVRVCSRAEAEREFAATQAAGAHYLAISDPGYPAPLSAIADAPPLIVVKGFAHLLDKPTLAIVGARNASANGARLARRLATDLGARGWIIASGLARGIDGAAHGGAMSTGTVAVLAGGIDVIYPRENERLYHEIAEAGVLISEMAAGAPPPSVFGASAGVSGGPALMVLFTHGGSGLGAKPRGELGGLAEGLRNYQGYVRIVGHASHRTGNMSQARHVSANFNVSVDRANVVARELVRQGVAAERLIVEAVGDARPRYYENMPGGEAENRRVEIFLE